MSPREARLGRWVLLYGILQVLSTLSVDVQGLRHTEGVRYFLNTDLKRMPEWVSNNQMEHLEATQQRSWCWQRTWDLMPTQSAPVELDATSIHQRVNRYPDSRNASRVDQSIPSPPPQQALPPPPSQGTTMIQDDIRRISEKIESLSLSHAAGEHIRQAYERRRENEKVIQDEFNDRKPRLQGETYLLQSTRDNNPNTNNNNNHDYDRDTAYTTRIDSLPRHAPPDTQRSRSRMDDFSLDFTDRHQQHTHHLPSHLAHSNMRSHTTSLNTDLGSYPFSQSDRDMQWPVPPGYSESAENGAERHRDERIVGTGSAAARRRVQERSGWN